jgi:hypothetical protein
VLLSGEKGENTMKKDHDSDMPVGELTFVRDFLPPPHMLVPRDDSVKVTLSLHKNSLDFFKREAKKNRVPYQRMIRALVDEYVSRQGK